MFTGLIEDIGEIKKITRIGSGKQSGRQYRC